MEREREKSWERGGKKVRKTVIYAERERERERERQEREKREREI